MSAILTIASYTLREAAKKRVLLASLLFGSAFLALFTVGLTLIQRDMTSHGASLLERRMMYTFVGMAGLYVANFLVVMTAIFMPVDTLSGEIATGILQTVASKPVRRSSIVLGKWIAYAVVLAGYLALMAGGTIVAGRIVTGFTPPGIAIGLPLMGLEALVLLTLSIAAGTRLSTLAGGVTVFGLYGIAFLGGWFEQIGTILGNGAARYLGTIASLVMPSESMWQRAAWFMQTPIVRDLHMSPFSPASLPSEAMVAWAVGYVVAVLGFAVYSFGRRPL
jgi:ABC-type transport system involved in multi-copper enzyme maturation permease subunit